MSATSTKDSQVSMRLPGELKARIETYAQMTGRSKSHVAMEALADYLDWRMPQVADLQQAVAAADRGEFASDAEVQAVLGRHAGGKARATPRRR
ncbi:MAG: CopG family transcriptional regulator [Burkholderiales bacterium]|nr:CopG family transcriptional regulator [Burkholderiales bacterium]